MNAVLLTYDVHDTIDHVQLKKTLLANGWVDELEDASGKMAHLPNTSFFKDNTNATTERDWFINLVNIKDIIRLIIYPVSPGWVGVYGVKHATDRF